MYSGSDSIPTIDPIRLKERIERGDKIVLLDVREHFELEQCRLPNITHIPISEIILRKRELNPEDEIVCICHVGQRSYQAAQYLRQSGFKRVLNLEGGMAAYIYHADPSLVFS